MTRYKVGTNSLKVLLE